MLYLTKRDRILFKYLFENKVATRDQINRDIFKTASFKAVNRRLNKLKRSKLIAHRPVALDNKMIYAYEVTRSGLEQSLEIIPDEVEQFTLKSDSIDHDLTLVDLIHHLKRLSGVTSIITENALQCYEDLKTDQTWRSYSYLHCDGVVCMKVNDLNAILALEYDKEIKSKKRYFKKLLDYYGYSEVQAVLYICENKNIKRTILEIDDQISDDGNSKFFLCLKDEVQNHTGQVTFENSKGQKFIIH